MNSGALRAQAVAAMAARGVDEALIGQVVDTFYVRNWSGELITDDFHRAEVQRAVLHAIG